MLVVENTEGFKINVGKKESNLFASLLGLVFLFSYMETTTLMDIVLNADNALIQSCQRP